jgi:cation diffusion facilitator CzcD-associated flavoprotein CzcO
LALAKRRCSPEENVDTAKSNDETEVAVIGAGPYGLAVAAHLNAGRISTRVLGRPLSFWREHMPKGMRLRSPWIASHIADPEKRYSLDVFASRHGIARQEQLPIERFVQYGEWFQHHAVPDLDLRQVRRIEPAARGFCLMLDDEALVHARRVVVAMGLAGQDLMPREFEGIGPHLVSHTSAHARLDQLSGKRVAVVGRGQSACESAVLLREAGSEVDLVCRGEVRWIGAAPVTADQDRHWRRHLHALVQAPSAVGPFPCSWLNEWPGLQHRLPNELRAKMAARSLRAAAAWWLLPRMEGVKVRAGRLIRNVRPQGSSIALEFNSGVQTYDHVLLGTGYRIDISRLGILSPKLISAIDCRDGAPLLRAGFESSVPGLHFVGASAVDSYGPLMRFIAGAGYAARSVARAAAAQGARGVAARGPQGRGYRAGSAQPMSPV